MPTKILVTAQDGTPKQIVFADHAGDFSPTAANDLRDATSGNRTNGQLALASLAGGSWLQSAKVDLGDNRAEAYDVLAAVETSGTSADTDRLDFFWGPSPNSTAGTANPGNLSGSAASYTGYNSNPEATANRMLDYIGGMGLVAVNSAQVFHGVVGTLVPTQQYGILVVGAMSLLSALQSDDVEMHIVLVPIVPEIQN